MSDSLPNLLSCPNDVLRMIIDQYLDAMDGIILRCTCRRFRSLFPEEHWKQRLERCRLKLYEHAVEHGYLSRLEWLFSQQRIRIPEQYPNQPTSFLCFLAARGGHLEVLKWARSNGCPWDKWTCSHAALGGHLEVLKWARSNGCPWNEWIKKLVQDRFGYVEK